MTRYAELAVTTNFSFLRGASHPAEMVAAAEELGLSAISIADRNSFAGVVRAFDQWKKRKREDLQLIVGVRLVTVDAFECLAYPTDREAYARLCRLLTAGKLQASNKEHTECLLTFEDILEAAEGQIFIALPPEELSSAFAQRLERLARVAPGRSYLAGVHRHRGDEPRRLGTLDSLAKRTRTPLVAVNDVHYHAPERRALADVVTCIREKCTIHEAGFRLAANAERHLKPPAEMARLFAAYPDAITSTLEIAGACRFTLADLKNEYPDEPVPPGKTAQGHLEDLTWAGAKWRYPRGAPQKVVDQIREELRLIAKLDYARYFLTVHDVVHHARKLKILCQGRGSAANSVVCFCLGITEVNPTDKNIQLLFSRFISERRNEPPDIDVDFEHERREEVIQYVYKRYGREYAAICATVIHYRSRRAIREVGKAMGLTPDVTAALARTVWGSHADGLPDKHIREAGFDLGNSQIRQSILLARELIGFPRHLSQHVGGFILTKRRLDETVPIANAAMQERTYIEWDKDDIDTLGLMKVDVLALGMLSTLRRGLDLLRTHYDRPLTLASIPQDGTPDAEKVYEMLGHADSVGVFQVESRAQMSMLPRLRPKEFYDLVIEVAIVRPGPIQGDMVHPYLRRRDGIEKEVYPSPAPPHPADELKEILSRTRGVPLFQEQAMQIAITAAEFTPDEADGLRRAMATFRHNGNVHLYRDKFIENMTARGYDPAFVERCFGQIEGFGEYGFPESHAASFALLVYASAWMKCHYPDVFCAAILNSQPMGFYQPAQLVIDAQKHGVEVRAPDVNFSDWDCTLEPASTGRHRFAVRLGFREIDGSNEDEMKSLVAARGNGYGSIERLAARGNGYGSIERLAAAPGVSRGGIERLAAADAFRSLGLDRRAALWAARRLRTIGTGDGKGKTLAPANETLPLFDPHLGDELFPEPTIALPEMQLPEHVAEDYVTTGLSLKAHPVSFFRPRLDRLGTTPNTHLRDERRTTQDQRITVAGLVLTRQMPGGKKVVFVTLEDETDIANIIVWPKVFASNRRTVMSARFLAVRGRLQRAGEVVHILAESFIDLSGELTRLRDAELLGGESVLPHTPQNPLTIKSRDFH
jgi:error-prone DNA polymerase